MDLEAESIVSIDTAMSADIATSCKKLLETQKKIEATEEELKKLKDVETTLSEQTIPNLMQQAGVELIKLEGGISVEVKPFYSARIPSSKSEEAFAWLRDNGHGDLIKNIVSIRFGKGENDSAEKLISSLEQDGLYPDQKRKVEPMTLNAFIGDQITNGKQVPMELLSVFTGNKVKIKKGK